MQYIKKRDGRRKKFDRKNIITAILAAFEEVDGNISPYAELKADNIADYVEDVVCKSDKMIDVEEIQDMVEHGLSATKRKDVAKAYILYRDERNRLRGNSIDKAIREIVEGTNVYWNDENSNKNPKIASTQRDYIAGQTSQDISRRELLPTDVVKAHDEGLIHFHDIDYFAQHIHNCFSGGTKFITDTGIRKFRDFKDGDNVYVKDLNGELRLATVRRYEKQQFQKVTLKNCKFEETITCTANHRWILKDGTITTNLKVGDKLYLTKDSTDYTINDYDDACAWCIGFIVGDGTDRKETEKNNRDSSEVRLCGKKIKYRNIFELASYTIYETKGSDDLYARKNEPLKQSFLNGGYKLLTAKHKALAFKGYMCADGNHGGSSVSTSDIRVTKFIEECSGIAGYYISSHKYKKHSTQYKENADIYEYHFIRKQPNNHVWKVTNITNKAPFGYAYCIEEPITHTFTLDKGIVTGNCCLVNLDDMLQNGTVINGTLIEKPHSFSTACNIATQIMAVVASGQYGGQSISLSDLAPFVDVSRTKIKNQLRKEFEDIDKSISDRQLNILVEEHLKREISRGVQTIQYQINTLNTSNGQTPFVTVYMYLGEVENEQTKNDLALIIEEVLNQRIQGVKNESGVYITPAFPKLIYVLEKDNITEDSKYWYLTELAAKCTAKRLVPDYISEKIMLELKGDVYPCMGCRSFLTPDRFTDVGVGNISNALNYTGKHKYYGRFNQGVVTINLPDVALTAKKELKDDEDIYELFWKILDDRLNLCHKALRCRHERLLGTSSDISPIHWQYGALARLEKGEPIDKLLFDGYSTISLGFAGLWECVLALSGNKLTEKEGEELGIKILQTLNDACTKWKSEENIDYSIYGTPLESSTYKFAKCLKNRFGVIEGITDKDYITNSYHVHVTEPIDAFSKLKLESKFQALSPGGAISYVEVPNLQNNLDAVLSVIKFIYDNIMYAELNTKSDYCQECGFDGEIQIVEDNGKLVWECPNCGNRNKDKLNVARRTCGYIGSNFWNQGRTQEIKERVLHL